MNGYRLYTAAVYCFIVSVLTVSHARAGVDPVQYFTQGSPEIIKKLGSKRGIDRYLARDRFGNDLQVRTGEPLSMFAEIGGSLLSQGIELPSLPAYPTFVQLEQSASPDPRWTRATVQMQGTGIVSAKSVSKLTPAQMGEWMGQMTLNHILGNQIILNSPEMISMAGQHVITPSLSQAFQGYAKPAEDGLARYLDLIPQAKLSALSQKDAAEALFQLNRYLSRLEKMTSKDIDKLFGAYFDSTAQSAELRTEIKQRIQNARAGVVQYLTAKYPQLAANKNLSVPVNVDRPVFHFPAYKASRGVSPSQVIGSPEFRLWAHYFHEPSQLQTTPVSEISKLLDEARERHEIFYVGPTIDPEHFSTELSDPPQTHLSPKNSKTLIVAPANDAEAIEICRVARSSGAHLMRLNGDAYKHGVKLSAHLANEIVETAKKLGVEKIAVVEMPGESPDVESVFAKNGFSFVPIDHHSDNIAARAQPFSSLEQAAQLLGYDLGGKSKTIEVSDRSFIAGLADLGLSKEAVKKLYPPKTSEAYIQGLTKFKSSKFGDFYVVKDYAGNFPELIGSITLHEWPKKVNVLIVGPGPMLRFSGNPKFRSVLTQKFESYEAQVRSHLHGGDAMRSQYWALKGIPRDSVDPFTAMALKEVGAVLDPADAKTFRDVLGSRVGISKSVLNAIDVRRAPSGSGPSCQLQQLKKGLSKW
ncbi:MAG: hypothetical protein ACJ763_19150 [Bdellovibrionia bacterium]